MSEEIPKLTESQEQAIIDRAIGEQARKKAKKFWGWVAGGGFSAILATGGWFETHHKPTEPRHEYHRQYQDSTASSGLAALLVAIMTGMNEVRADVRDIKEGQVKIIENQRKFSVLVDSTPTGRKIKKEYEQNHPRPFLGFNN